MKAHCLNFRLQMMNSKLNFYEIDDVAFSFFCQAQLVASLTILPQMNTPCRNFREYKDDYSDAEYER
jgi:hypothetical protein